MLSQIIRIPTGYVNQVNDPSIGQLTAPPFGPSPFSGQLGKRFQGQVGEEINYNSSIGTVYGGTFRYVRLAAASAVPIIGQILFWDISVADSFYQVTTSESGGTNAAVFIAGICLSASVTVGNYTVIQDEGRVPVKFRAALTSAGAIGSPVYAAGVGGADLGFADVLQGVGTASQGDVSLMIERYLGDAVVAPTNGGLTDVYLQLKNIRG